MSERESFEAIAAKKLRLPVEIIRSARNGVGYLHAFDSMSVMQPLNEWWAWWQASREALNDEQKPIGEVQLGEHDDTGSHPDARVVCLHDQADWENFPEGTKLYLNPLPSPPSNHPIDTTSHQYEALGKGGEQ
ncbi:hypothetical protein ACP26C_12650 [Franconibacter helveticus 513]|uniref:hypothetical protein n=1 Tax=Franconibacter helveticus TaxID=357240 RepID=UPI000467C702|nr:hypothetical protein [Franconibacter helveticus]